MGLRLGRLSTALLPSFISDRWDPLGPKKYKMHPTSYLDGLRGIVCLIVYFCHYTEENHYHLSRYYWSENSVGAFIQLPYFRLIFSGRPMVHIFFIMSGFALSLRPLRHIHEGDNDKAYSAVASSIIRRPVRLFGPCVVSTFCVVVLLQMGLLWQPMATVSQQVYSWLWVLGNQICWPWEWEHDMMPGYDIHLWTIPIEFCHSMLVFLVLIPMVVVKPLVRLIGIPCIAIYCQWSGNWAGFEFIAGMFLAEIYLRKNLPQTGMLGLQSVSEKGVSESPQVTRKVLRTTFLTIGLLVCFYVDGWPNLDRDMTPFFKSLHDMTPSKSTVEGYQAIEKFWFSLSGLFVVWACGEIEWIKSILEHSISQYMGRVSFSVYIVHGPVMNVIQRQVLGRLGEGPVGEPGEVGYSPGVEPSGINGFFGLYTPTQMMMSWLAGLIVMGPVVFAVADLFWRYVDIPMINLARRVEKACIR
ncbi:hypothetical protein CFIMG_004003RAa [Ceratocystis fimbriata CBS 114723]|uniref:Acyltransferase 3 domain-containing protein n=1 Tax=Ceratocystis fimbriata CBS 114723 TaxID=1035309 RepID=A0A2C5WUG7_9PEZI|nr:hypothetical protein CFIMG_004003RAa [Ceratocystis fimbriata CBS 114723]